MSDDEITDLLARKAMGWERGKSGGRSYWWENRPEGRRVVGDWDPLNDIAAAWMLVEKLGSFRVDKVAPTTYLHDVASADEVLGRSVAGASCYRARCRKGPWLFADSACKAICAAALKALKGGAP